MRRAFDLLLVVALAILLGFLLLPLLALFLRVSPGTLFAQLGSDVALDALWVTVKTGLIAHVLVVGLGTPAAYLLGTRQFRGRSLVLTAIELPLVLPPAVAGIALIAAFGRRGLLGGKLEAAGITISLTQAAVVLAVAFVASPFYLRQAIEAFASVDRALLDASRTLGSGPFRTFRRVALPLAARDAIVAGEAEVDALVEAVAIDLGVADLAPLLVALVPALAARVQRDDCEAERQQERDRIRGSDSPSHSRLLSRIS